jgi:hypothetical protein
MGEALRNNDRVKSSGPVSGTSGTGMESTSAMARSVLTRKSRLTWGGISLAGNRKP